MTNSNLKTAELSQPASFNSLVAVMKKLRSSEGCPWDREQTHSSLIKYLKEESAELIQAIENNDMENLEEELGDLLLQILFHSQLASERGDFDIYDVVDTLQTKLILRHPHVFGDEKGKKWTSQDVKDRWDELKGREKKIREELIQKRKKSRK